MKTMDVVVNIIKKINGILSSYSNLCLKISKSLYLKYIQSTMNEVGRLFSLLVKNPSTFLKPFTSINLQMLKPYISTLNLLVGNWKKIIITVSSSLLSNMKIILHNLIGATSNMPHKFFNLFNEFINYCKKEIKLLSWVKFSNYSIKLWQRFPRNLFEYIFEGSFLQQSISILLICSIACIVITLLDLPSMLPIRRKKELLDNPKDSRKLPATNLGYNGKAKEELMTFASAKVCSLIIE